MNKNLVKKLQKTPIIPEKVYENLPSILKKATGVFDEPRVKDLFTLSLLSAISGCFPNTYGIYDEDRLNLNLNTFITAPPASGKGKMKYAGIAIQKIDELYNEIIKSLPNFKGSMGPSLIIPGNATSSSFINLLTINRGSGVLIETEADTLINALKGEMGNFSDIIRKSFHNETISQLRRKDNEHLVIKDPKLSLILSGTIDQYQKFLNSIDNGFFSRFMYYSFDRDFSWKSRKPKKNSRKLQEFFHEEIGNDLLNVFNSYFSKRLEFSFTEKQWTLFDKKNEERISNFPELEMYSQLFFRHGVMTFKIAGVLTLLRAFDYNLELSDSTTSSDMDYWIASEITEVVLKHALITSQLFLSNDILENQYVWDILTELSKYTAFLRKDFANFGETLSTIKKRQLFNIANSLINHGVLQETCTGSLTISPIFKNLL